MAHFPPGLPPLRLGGYRGARVKASAALLLSLLVASGAMAWGCVTACPDELDGPCPPSCTRCLCTSHHHFPGVLSDAGSAPTIVLGRQEPVRGGEPSPGTSPDILHVPRA